MSTQEHIGTKNLIGLGIKKFRKESDLTLSELAQILDSSQGYLSEIERGIKVPGSNLIKKLKENFPQIDLNKLFLIEDENDPHLNDLTLD